jgi:signal transduction histidine kinase
MNRKSFKSVLLLIIVAISGLVILQAAWLIKMFSQMDGKFSQLVSASMEKAAYDEFALRKSKYNIFYVNANKTDSININALKDKAGSKPSQSFKNRKEDVDTISSRIDIGEDGGLKRRILSTYYIQKGPQQIDLHLYDSLLTQYLRASGMDLRHSVSLVEHGSLLFRNGRPLKNGRVFSVPVSMKQPDILFKLEIENPDRIFFKEMSGIVLSSVLIILILCFTFIYLIRTLFKQKSLEEMRMDFTHNITHELKTPIAVAYAANDALMNFSADEDPVKRGKYLSIVNDQIKSLSDMVERILKVSMEEREDYSLTLSRFDLEDLFYELTEKFKLSCSKPVLFKLSVEPEALHVTADRFHLSNILGNTIDNALKYSGDSVEIKLDACRRNGFVLIRISDNGIGIESKYVEKIFDKFYRVPKGNIQDVRGFGLGLYYAKLIVEKHGGIISVESDPGHGTEIIIKLPDHEK